MRTAIAIIGAFGIIGFLFWLLTQFPAPVTSQSQHAVATNNTNAHIVVTNNMPPDYASIALVILAIAALLFVLFRFVVPTIRDWMEGSDE